MLLSTNWERVKCRGLPIKSWVTGIESLKQELDLQNGVLNAKQICKAIESRELWEFEMALQYKYKLHIYKELKGEVRLEEYLEYVKGGHARLFLNFVLVLMAFLRNWVCMLIRVGHRNVLIVGPLKSQLSMFY